MFILSSIINSRSGFSKLRVIILDVSFISGYFNIHVSDDIFLGWANSKISLTVIPFAKI